MRILFRLAATAALLAALLTTSSCAGFGSFMNGLRLTPAHAAFLHPGHTQDARDAHTDLAGNWPVGDKGEMVLALEHRYGSRYHLRLDGPHGDEECRDDAPLDARLFRLGRTLFLDVMPRDRRPHDADALLHQPTHLFLKVEPDGRDGWTFRLLNPVWVACFLDHNPQVLAHERTGRRVLVTAPTEDVQRFLATVSGVPEAFTDSFTN